MPSPEVVLVVPCYNESARLDEAAFLAFTAAHPGVTLLFVDDGSEDGTFTTLRRMEEAAPARIATMRLPENRGKAEAVRRGVLEGIRTGAALVGFWDADLSTPLGALDDFLAVAHTRPDMEMILGARAMLMGRTIRRSPWRHYLGRVFATAASLALDLPIYDTQCGAKLFRTTEAVAGTFAQPFRSAWIFDVEVLARYLYVPVPEGEPPRRARIYELAVPEWSEVPGSKLRPGDFLRSMFELAGIWRDRRAGRPARSRTPLS